MLSKNEPNDEQEAGITMELWLVELSLFGVVSVGAVDPDIPEASYWEASLRRGQDEHVQARYYKTAKSPAAAVRDLHMQVYHDVMMK